MAKFAKGFKVPSEKIRLKAISDGNGSSGDESVWFESTSSFNGIPFPRSRDDWLAQYAEEGQTVAEFQDENPWLSKRKIRSYGGNFRPDSVHINGKYPEGKIYLAQIGEFSPDYPSAEKLAEFASVYLGIPVEIFGVFKVEKSADGEVSLRAPELGERKRAQKIRLKVRRDEKSGRIQINCPHLLNHLRRFIPTKDGLTLIALTQLDLYESDPDLFVAGLAQGLHRVALFSFARYDPNLEFSTEFWHEIRRKDAKVRDCSQRGEINVRCYKLLVHELGHLLGLDHCIFYDCCMNGSGHLEEDFRQPLFLCPVCLKKLHLLVGFDIGERYSKLETIAMRDKMENEVVWIRERLQKCLKEANKYLRMFPDVSQFLNVDPDSHRLISINENVEKNFLIHHFTSETLKKNEERVVFLALEQTFGHYNAVGLKLGVNLQKLRDSRLIFIEGLKIFLESYSSDSVERGFADEMFQRIQDAVGNKLKGSKVVLIVDKLSLLLSMGLTQAACSKFFRRITNFCLDNGVRLIVSTSSGNDELRSQIDYLAHLTIHLEPLATGSSYHVHGNIRVEDKVAHFKIEDKNVRIFALGESKAVL